MIDYTPKRKLESYEKFSNKYSSALNRLVATNRINPVQSGHNPRQTAKIPSLVSSGGGAPLKESPKYTGTEMIGISIIHKSCLQPVFNQQSAKDAASMRR